MARLIQEPTFQDGTVHIRLSEHDAYQLLKLVENEQRRCEVAWRPYWERQAGYIRQRIEQASFGRPLAGGPPGGTTAA